MSSSELDTRNIAVSMRKSVENLVVSSQDAIGQSISQALSFSGVISNNQGHQETRSISRSPSPSPRNSDNFNNTEYDTDRQEKKSESNASGDSASVLDVSLSTSKTVDIKITSPQPAAKTLEVRSKKKSWYSALYPTYKSRSDDFKRLFKDLPDDERLIVDYSCALQKDILAHGRLYASQNYLCFHANIFGWETSMSLRWKDVTAITKEKTALVIPNAILVCTENEKNFLTSFSGRDKAYLMLFRVWQNALMDQPMSSHEIWQWVHSCYGEELGFTSDDELARDLDERCVTAPDSHTEELLDSSSMDAGSGSAQEREDHRSSRQRNHDSLPPPARRDDVDIRDDEAGDTLPTDMSDTESEPDKLRSVIEAGTCTSPHEGKVILQRQFDLNIDLLFTMIFTNSKIYLELLAARDARDYVQSSWQSDPTSGLQCRQISYTLALSGSIGPKEVYVTESQMMNACCRPGALYSVDVSSENSGIPYADCFTVEAHYCLRRVTDTVTALSVCGLVKYKKSMWTVVKSFLEKSAIDGLEKYIKQMEQRLLMEAQGGAPAKRKGRRRRRAISPPPAPLAPPTTPATVRTPRPLLLLLAVLLLLNVTLYWLGRASHEPRESERPPRMGSISEAQLSDWSRLLERHTHRQRSELLAWRDLLDRAVANLAQTEKALTKILETIKPSLERAHQDASNQHHDEL